MTPEKKAGKLKQKVEEDVYLVPIADTIFVIPAKVGISGHGISNFVEEWIPAFAGVTD